MPRPREAMPVGTTSDCGDAQPLEGRQAEGLRPLRALAVARVGRAHRDGLGLAGEERHRDHDAPVGLLHQRLHHAEEERRRLAQAHREDAPDGHALGGRRRAQQPPRAQHLVHHAPVLQLEVVIREAQLLGALA